MLRLETPRLVLDPITLPMVEAVMLGRRELAESIAGARLPDAWPGPALVERAFTVSLEAMRRDPATRLWGDRLMIAKGPSGGERTIVGSVVFHGRPDDGVAEVAYGVEQQSQGLGYATEATLASVAWALGEPGIRMVTASTLAWHSASLKVLRKVGMRQVDVRPHEMFGEVLIYGVAGRPGQRAASTGRGASLVATR